MCGICAVQPTNIYMNRKKNSPPVDHCNNNNNNLRISTLNPLCIKLR